MAGFEYLVRHVNGCFRSVSRLVLLSLDPGDELRISSDLIANQVDKAIEFARAWLDALVDL